MSKRVCAEPGCPTLTTPGNTYCTHHTRTHDHARGTRQQRGYDANFQRERRKAKAQVTKGGVHCWRCGHPINPHEPFDLGHDDNNRQIIRGPEHIRCNRATRSKQRQQTTNSTTQQPPGGVPQTPPHQNRW